jgi:hypothetical protein
MVPLVLRLAMTISFPLQWKDQIGFGANRDSGTTPPSMVAMWSTLMFGPAYANGDQTFFFIQFNHDYAEGTDIAPHIHWVSDQASDQGTNTLRFSMSYMWANIGDQFPASLTTVSTAAHTVLGADVRKHMITSFGTVTGTGKKISSIFLARVYRNDPGSSPSGNYFIIGMDPHYQVNSAGSNFETSKVAP